MNEPRLQLPESRRTIVSALMSAIFVCAGFAATAGAVVWLRMFTIGFEEEPGFYVRLATKTAFFSLLAMAAFYVLLRQRPKESAKWDPPGQARLTMHDKMALFAIIVAASILIFVNLDSYPWTAPDELHHLIVARNLAEHGVYASGSPDTEFVHFDPYDSVGPTVILPVAGAFSIAGTSLVAARIVMGGFFLAFLVLGFIFFQPVLGRRATICGTILAILAFGSIYLGRTLYGEVPAFAFFIAGLLCWRHAIGRHASWMWPILAGVLLGLAILTKLFLLISVWAFIGAIVYDRFSSRRIGWRAILFPPIGVAVVLSAWTVVETLAQPDTAGGFSSIVYYRHYLMFGLDSVSAGVSWLLREQPGSLAVSLAALILATPLVLARRYDPAAFVLLLTAVLFAFWWLFFTTGLIPRYLWYTAAAAAFFSGLIIDIGIRWLRTQRARASLNAAGAALVFATLAPFGLRLVDQGEKVLFVDEMADELAVADYIKQLPNDVTVATTYWPLERSVDFFVSRRVAVTEDASPNSLIHDVLILDAQTQQISPNILKSAERKGRYVIVTADSEGGVSNK